MKTGADDRVQHGICRVFRSQSYGSLGITDLAIHGLPISMSNCNFRPLALIRNQPQGNGIRTPQDPIVNRCVAVKEKATQRNSHRAQMSSRRATQVDRQMGQSRQLGNNQHADNSRTLIDTELYKPLQPSESRHISQLRAPGDLEFRESPSEIRDVERGNARELRTTKNKKRARS